MAGSTRWEGIKTNLPGNKQTWSCRALPAAEQGIHQNPHLSCKQPRVLLDALLAFPAAFPEDPFPSGMLCRQDTALRSPSHPWVFCEWALVLGMCWLTGGCGCGQPLSATPSKPTWGVLWSSYTSKRRKKIQISGYFEAQAITEGVDLHRKAQYTFIHKSKIYIFTVSKQRLNLWLILTPESWPQQSKSQ